MPLNALIPMSFEAPDLPDVNAMMQTRAQGMANIVDIERQRAADAQAAQARQAEELTAALSPAIAAAFSDPSDAGLNAALGLVPEQYRGAAQSQLDQLRSIGDLNQRKNIMRAALVQDEVGQALLAQLEPTANMRLQADTAASAQALKRRELQLREQQAQAAKQAPISTQQPPKETAEEVKKRLADEKRAKDLDLAIGEVEDIMQPGGLIDQATGSYIGNLVDTAAAAIGAGTEGSAAIARLAPIADLVLKMVPRFEGPQSNFDVQSYKDAAGNLANPNVPVSVKKAAATEIVRLFRKYRDQFEYAGGGAPAEDRGGAGGGEPGIIDFGDLGD
jgi:hypothetical protein